MSFKLIETIDNGYYDTAEVFKCTDCGRTFTVSVGGDIACCPCEFENEV